MSSRSEALLDHIVDFLKFISSAQSFWFLLDTSYGHGCHLSQSIPFGAERLRGYVASCRAMTMAATLPIASVWTPTSMRLCCLSSRRPWCCLVVLAGCRIASCRPLIAPPSRSRRLATPAGCHIAPFSHCAALLLSCCASWLSRHHLSPSSRCTALLSSHRLAGCCIACPCATLAVECCLPPSNTTATAVIERRLYRPPLPQLPSIATVKRQRPPSSNTAVKC